VYSIYFDKADRELLRMVNAALDSEDRTDAKSFNPNLHPHGILELATTHEFRMAHAAIHLLERLAAGQVEERLQALQTLHDEVLHSARTPFRYNTGRVLLQLMKEIVRSRHDEAAQLQLMHDFRKAASGNPRVVRHFLARCHLLEMPEAWNQLTMDHHVHDANTKGRKNPTHLIMDAWIKGIRYLSVVYYNFIEPEATRELLRAAEIMDITVRVGIEFRAVFRDRFVNFVWTPRGFSDTEAVLSFLGEKPTQALMNEGRKATFWVEGLVIRTLERWNAVHRLALMADFGMELPPISQEDFRSYVHTGQASILHLAELIHKTYLPLFRLRVAALQEEYEQAPPAEREKIAALIGRIDALLPEIILQKWLTSERNPELAWFEKPCAEANMPEIMHLPPEVLLDWLSALRSGYRITLQLAGLTPEDVLELLWDGQGLITHLELFNLKEWQENHLKYLEEINEIQRALNDGSILHIKRILLGMLKKLAASGDAERHGKFQTILRNIPALQAPYKAAPLQSCIGTDSTSNSSFRHGMGLAVLETLPRRTRRELGHNGGYKPIFIPVRAELAQTKTWRKNVRISPAADWIYRQLRRLPGCARAGLSSRLEWVMTSMKVKKEGSNIITMGGISGVPDNGLRTVQSKDKASPQSPGFAYLNTHLYNGLKVLGGFIPAQLAFWLTQDWWWLVWFGAFIWYAITVVRNIVQAVFSGGFGQNSVLRWNNYVDWPHICEALFFTGWSVLLLEWGVRFLLLQNTLSLTVVNAPLTVFTVLAMVNGAYLSWNNAVRGLPRSVMIGNIIRSVVSIPLSMAYFHGLCLLLGAMGEPEAAIVLQPGAAIISKVASDTVAGFIESFAARNNNRRLRLWDYSTKLNTLFTGYAGMEISFPDHDVLEFMGKPAAFAEFMLSEAPERLQNCAVNALDLLYFWMYQPYAQQTLFLLLRTLTPEERLLLARSQWVLMQTRLIGQMFVDGLVGANFARALSFYLGYHEQYITDINQLCARAHSKKGEFVPLGDAEQLTQRSFKGW